MPRKRLFRHMIYAFLTHETACSVVRKMPFQPEKGSGRLRRRYNMPSGETYGRIVNGLSACPFFCFYDFLMSNFFTAGMNKYTFPPTCSGFVRRLCGRACRIRQGVRIALLWSGKRVLLNIQDIRLRDFYHLYEYVIQDLCSFAVYILE